MATQHIGDHTGETITREGGPPVTQTPPAPTDNGGKQPRRGGVRYAAIAVAVLVMVAGVLVARGFGGSPALEPPSSVTTATSAIPTSSAPTTAANAASAEQTAIAATTQVMNSWIASYANAYTSFDAGKLDSNLTTPEVLAVAKTNLDRFAPVKGDGATARYTAQTIAVKEATFTGSTLSISVCALRDVRFIKNGQDVTIDAAGKPYPPRTQPTWQTFEFTGGPTAWKVSKFETNTEAGPAC